MLWVLMVSDGRSREHGRGIMSLESCNIKLSYSHTEEFVKDRILSFGINIL